MPDNLKLLHFEPSLKIPQLRHQVFLHPPLFLAPRPSQEASPVSYEGQAQAQEEGRLRYMDGGQQLTTS